RAADLDPYEPGHAQRLEALKGHISPSVYNSIARRFQSTGKAAAAPATRSAMGAPREAATAPPHNVDTPETEPTVLEDFILQAEIYLQYGMRSKALERLERVSRLFPREEQNNEKLRHLYASAGFTPAYGSEVPAKKAAAAPTGTAKSAAKPAAS